MMVIDSPVGHLRLRSRGDALCELSFTGEPLDGRGDRVLRASARQLGEYFAGQRQSFDLPLSLSGSEFEQRVWGCLREIPFGETVSYGWIAAQLGDPRLARAVGVANGRNPVAIVVPCHRVIGADGSLTGFGGGLGRKRALLELEAGVTTLFQTA
jgi:methylated-DNA-[protein]-cysteine S-methyltransferase